MSSLCYGIIIDLQNNGDMLAVWFDKKSVLFYQS